MAPSSAIAAQICSQAKADGATKSLEELNFDNLSLRALPVDESFDNNPRQVLGACFALTNPTPVKNPKLVAASPEALALLDIHPDQVQRADFAEYFSSNQLLHGARPAAHCYCGHQFGYFSGQLGDGATMYLGEVVNRHGQRWELQFKGAGKTPFSRQADGRKVLRSSIREFLASEAMYYLGVPTTRAGTCVTSESRVVRDILYNGNAIMERCTIITRIAPTFLRFGSFEIFKPTDNMTGRTGPSVGKEAQMLPSMLNHVVRVVYPHIWEAHGGDGLAAELAEEAGGSWADASGGLKAKLQAMYLEWFTEVVRRTASLVAAWQCVGWCHGVLNTDNMSVAGITIDYGPFGFMDRYDPDYVSNGSDDGGRYDVKGQVAICKWNCEKLAEAIKFCLPEAQGKRAVAEVYDAEYTRAYLAIMRSKLGLTVLQEDADLAIVQKLLDAMAEAGADFTNTFRCLSRVDMPPAVGGDAGGSGSSSGSSSGDGDMSAWLAAPSQVAVLDHILEQCADVSQLVEASSPRIPPHNLKMLSMLALKDPELLHQLGLSQATLNAELARLKRSEALAKLSAAQKRDADRARFSAWLLRYGQRLRREAGAGASASRRVEVMDATNPWFVLRNWIAQVAIEKAEKGDFSEVQRVLDLLRQPYTVPSDATAADTASATASGTAKNLAPAGPSTSAAAAATDASSSGDNGDHGSGSGSAAVEAAASGSAAAAAPSGLSCALPYAGKPPAWASGLVVT